MQFRAKIWAVCAIAVLLGAQSCAPADRAIPNLDVRRNLATQMLSPQWRARIAAADPALVEEFIPRLVDGFVARQPELAGRRARLEEIAAEWGRGILAGSLDTVVSLFAEVYTAPQLEFLLKLSSLPVSERGAVRDASPTMRDEVVRVTFESIPLIIGEFADEYASRIADEFIEMTYPALRAEGVILGSEEEVWVEIRDGFAGGFRRGYATGFLEALLGAQ